jgi:hypothetical protein
MYLWCHEALAALAGLARVAAWLERNLTHLERRATLGIAPKLFYRVTSILVRFKRAPLLHAAIRIRWPPDLG